MTGQSQALLNLIVFLPLLAAVVIGFLPKEQHHWIRTTALWSSIGCFVLSLVVLFDFKPNPNVPYDFITEFDWIKQFGIKYKIGVDGISLVLLVLTTLLSWVAI